MTKEEAIEHLKSERNKRKELADYYDIPQEERNLENALNVAISIMEKAK